MEISVAFWWRKTYGFFGGENGISRWNLCCGLDTSSTIPKVGYFVMWSDNAGFKAPGEAPSTPQACFLIDVHLLNR